MTVVTTRPPSAERGAKLFCAPSRASLTIRPVTSLRVELAVPARLLVLIGGGEFSFGETREIDEFLLRSMPADRRTVAFIPAASGSAEYAVHFGKYLQG